MRARHRRRTMLGVQITDANPGQEDSLDGARQLHASEVRAVGIQRTAPSTQILEGSFIELAFQLGALRRIDLGRREQRLDKRFDVQPRAAHDERGLLDLGSALYPLTRFPGPTRGRIAFGGLGDIDAIVRRARTLRPGRFGGADIEVTVDLSRIRAHNRRTLFGGELECYFRFAGRRGSTDNAQPIGGQSGARLRPR